MDGFIHIKSISKLHKLIGAENPKHPLLTVIDYSKISNAPDHYNVKFVTDFYIISMKEPAADAIMYGRQYYDFEEGTLFFMSPGQVFSVGKPSATQYKGWALFFHPDLIIGTALAKRIKSFTFFSYAVNEALHVSEDEKEILNSILQNIEKEYKLNIDDFSNSVIITAIEQLLNYSQRYYSRQFITRRKENSDLITRFEQLLSEYFNSAALLSAGMPSVEYFAAKLNLSPNYLSDLLKKETGKPTKAYIQSEILEQAKYRLLNSNETVNEIAYSLGFEYPQYFNRFFKTKTGITPSSFRNLN
ncbi:AraC family transcriptional regulator [Flavobacterium cyanobacteriorum]|uniref:AraC family transcriptional regulator n=1 Tax=Flavobacterium cyanobacteriorum TaxID=2022802 RepID=A0A255ZLU7_9FLAO|nr:response regulator transcription factor [Flavobacterium cyanobacteriorum]OYQ42503.1 AraC family transcriptional regulator [Flavobacterium cyanobacteriorum]